MLCCRWRRSISAITEPTAAWPWTFTARTNTPLNCVRLELPALFSKRNLKLLPVRDFILGAGLPQKRRETKPTKLMFLQKGRRKYIKNQFVFGFLSFFYFYFLFLNKNVFLVNAVNVNVRLFILQRRPSRSILSDRWITADYQSRRLLSNTN